MAAGFNIAGGILGMITSGITSASQAIQSQDLAREQNAFNLLNWHIQNDYNKPVNQMKRLEEAGLNPALLYGNISTGNAQQMQPHQVGEPWRGDRLSEDVKDAFNIVGLKTAVAAMRKAEAEADNARTDADRNKEELEGTRALGSKYDFDPATGALIKVNDGVFDANKPVTVYKYPHAHWVQTRALMDNYRTNSLLVPRANLIGTQAYLNRMRSGLIAPQIGMMNYQNRYFPWTFWIGNAKNGLQGLSSFINPFIKF